MESLISYKDPLFGLIVLFFIIFIVALINFSLSNLKAYTTSLQISKIVNNFSNDTDGIVIQNDNFQNDNFGELLEQGVITTNSLLALVEALYKACQYNESVRIVLAIMPYIDEPIKRQKAIKVLAKSYYKIGFFMRSVELFKEALSIHSEDKEALQYLFLLFDKLNDYESASAILESLDEIGIDVERIKHYIDTELILRDSDIPLVDKVERLALVCGGLPFFTKALFGVYCPK